MTDIEFQLECLTRDLILLLIERQGMSMQDALHTLYTSDTYVKLKDTRSGLYFQSPGYVYDFLDKEISTGKVK